MSDVKRYRPDTYFDAPTMMDDIAGGYVEYDDYKALLGRLDERAKYEDALISSNRLLAEERDAALGRLNTAELQLGCARAEAVQLRELLNVYNLGGWTDSERLIKERDEARSKLEPALKDAEMLQHFRDVAHAHDCASLTDAFVELVKLRAQVGVVETRCTHPEHFRSYEGNGVWHCNACKQKIGVGGELVVETAVSCGHYLAKPFPCIKSKGHDGEHESSVGQRWPVVEKIRCARCGASHALGAECTGVVWNETAVETSVPNVADGFKALAEAGTWKEPT